MPKLKDRLTDKESKELRALVFSKTALFTNWEFAADDEAEPANIVKARALIDYYEHRKQQVHRQRKRAIENKKIQVLKAILTASPEVARKAVANYCEAKV